MSRRAHGPLFAVASLTLGGGCALVYDYSGYTADSTTTGSGGATSTATSSSSSSSVASGTGGGGGGSATSSGTGGAEGPLVAAWSRRFGGLGRDVVGYPGLDLSPLGDAVFLSGAFSGEIDLGTGKLTSPKFGIFVAKLDATAGATTWSKSVANTTSEVPTLAAMPDGGVVVAASFDMTATISNGTVMNAGLHDIFLGRYTADGSEVWARRLGDAEEQLVHAVAVDPASNVYITGEFKGQLALGSACGTVVASTSFSNGFLAQFDGGGACLWVKRFGANAYGSSLSADAGGVAIGGAFTGPASFGTTMLDSPTQALFVARLTAIGDESFATTFAGVDVQVLSDPTTSHVFYGANLPAPNGGDMIVGELDALGGPVGSKSYGGAGTDHLVSLARAFGGDLLFSGDTTGDLALGPTTAMNHGSQDMFVARISANGTTLGCIELGDSMPQFGRNVRIDKLGNPYLYGDFRGSIDLGNGKLSSAGDFDLVIARLILP